MYTQTVIFQTIQFSVITVFCLHIVKCKKRVLIDASQFNITQFISILPIYRTQSRSTSPGQSGPESHGNEGVHWISQSSSIIVASQSDGLVSYPEHMSEGGVYRSAEIQLVYSTAPANWGHLSYHVFLYGFSPTPLPAKHSSPRSLTFADIQQHYRNYFKHLLNFFSHIIFLRKFASNFHNEASYWRSYRWRNVATVYKNNFLKTCPEDFLLFKFNILFSVIF